MKKLSTLLAGLLLAVGLVAALVLAPVTAAAAIRIALD